MSHWKFICTWETERECLIRQLVGNDSEEDNEGNRLDVSEGDTIFLHRTINVEDRRGYLLGPFVATSDSQHDIVEDAWSHLSTFSWQARIGWEDTVYSLNLKEFYEEKDNVQVDITAYAQAFNEVQGLYLEGQVKNGNPIISPP